MKPELEQLEGRELPATWANPLHITYSLTYLKALGDISRDVVRAEAKEAVKLWDSAVPGIKCYQVSGKADIDFYVGQLDGPGYSTLWGYGYYPPNGKIILDQTETWTRPMLDWIAPHEVGHSLGLYHSANKEDMMYPYFNKTNPVTSLSDADIAIAIALYTNNNS